jgi:hypothetical protein
MFQRFIPILIATAFAGGCAGTVEYRGTATVTSTTPDLVAVAPGVQVIADYDEPIFYANGFYWWEIDGVWYRSSNYTGGWVYVSTPPRVIAEIRTPYRYRHYRPSNYEARRRPVPVQRVERPRRTRQVHVERRDVHDRDVQVERRDRDRDYRDRR